MRLQVGVALIIVVALVLASNLGVVAYSQEVLMPRHPPAIVPDPVQPVATIIADRYDLAYLARLGYVQSEYVASLTGGEFSAANKVASALNHIYNGLISNDWKVVWASLDLLKSLVTNMSPSELRFLASSNSITLPACSRLILNDQGVPTEVYVIENRYNESNPYALCLAPTDTLVLNSALDTILSLLSMTHNKTVAPGVFIVVLVNVPPEAAYPQVIQAIIEGRLGEQVLEAAAQGNQNLTALVEALFQQVESGDKEEATAALRQLLELARSGIIDWDLYAQALRTYQDRFGEPPQVVQPPETSGQEEVDVDLNNLLKEMQNVVEAAEKARIEAETQKSNSSIISIPSDIRITPPDPSIILLGGIALAASLIYRERERIIPDTTLPRVLLGIPPRNADPRWCYKALVEILKLKGLPKATWETPAEYYNRIKDYLDPDVQVLVEDLTLSFEKAVYGGEHEPVDGKICLRRLREVMLRWRAPKGG